MPTPTSFHSSLPLSILPPCSGGQNCPQRQDLVRTTQHLRTEPSASNSGLPGPGLGLGRDRGEGSQLSRPALGGEVTPGPEPPPLPVSNWKTGWTSGCLGSTSFTSPKLLKVLEQSLEGCLGWNWEQAAEEPCKQGPGPVSRVAWGLRGLPFAWTPCLTW